jgi:acyl-CoA synthetase (AMP-forming)/AMP-acid ligase II
MTALELEQVIAAHPAVWRCVVLAATGPSGEPVLTAHYVLEPAAGLTAVQLRDYLARRLPTGRPAVEVVLRRHAAFPPSRKATVELDLMNC